MKTALKNWASPTSLNFPIWIMSLWRCGICFNKNQPLSSLTTFKTNILPLVPPDNGTNAQAFLAATQTPSGKKSEETEEIYRASLEPVEVEAIRTTYPMVLFREKVRSLGNLLVPVSSYDTFQKRTILPIQEIKSDGVEMRKRRMVSIPKRGG